MELETQRSVTVALTGYDEGVPGSAGTVTMTVEDVDNIDMFVDCDSLVVFR